jgi:hypothetical protein
MASDADVRAIVHEVLGSHGDETILEYIVGECAARAAARAARAAQLVASG